MKYCLAKIVKLSTREMKYQYKGYLDYSERKLFTNVFFHLDKCVQSITLLRRDLLSHQNSKNFVNWRYDDAGCTRKLLKFFKTMLPESICIRIVKLREGQGSCPLFCIFNILIFSQCLPEVRPVARQILSCYTSIARLGFKYRATRLIRSIELVRRLKKAQELTSY